MIFLIIFAVILIGGVVFSQMQDRQKRVKDKKTLPERLSVRYFDETVLLSDSEAWTYMRLPTMSLEFRTPEEWDRVIAQLAHALAGLNECRIHIKTAFRNYDIVDWAEQLDQRTKNPAPGWGDLLLAQQEHLWHEQFLQKEVYLGVRLGYRNNEAATAFQDLVKTAKGFVDNVADSFMGEDDSISEAEIKKWHQAAGPIQRLVRSSIFAGVPVTTDELVWLFRHQMHPDMPMPPAPAMENEPWGRGEIQHLAEGLIDQAQSPFYLKITQPNWDFHRMDDSALLSEDEELPERFLDTYVATLCVSRMPVELETWDGNPWIHHAEDPELGFPVEFSAYYDIAPPVKAKKEVEKQVQKVSAQAKHIAESGAEVPTGVADAFYAGKDLDAEVERARKYLIFGAPRFMISAPTEELLTKRCQAFIEHYRNIGIDVAWTPNDQLRLFAEQFPGDRPRLKVRAYRQVQELETVTAGLFTASTSLGDGEGPYIGRTTGRSEEIVQFDPLYAPRNNKPPGVAIVGQPGGGKTFTTLTITYQTAMRGITTVLLDPKGDAKGLAMIPELGDVRILELGAKLAGLLDPFSLAESREEGTLLAMETLRLLLGGEMTADRETVIVAAIRWVATQPQPNLRKVVDCLLEGGVDARSGNRSQFAEQQIAVARSAGNLLQVISELPLGNLCFSNATSSVKIAQGRLTIITLAGLSLPSATTDQSDYTYGQRLSVTLLYLVTHYARTLVSDPLYTGPKAMIIDEAWAITQTSQGAQLVAEVARLGRSRNTALSLVSQNAKDLLAEDVKNCLTTMFVFRSEDPDEIAADMELLRIASNEEHQGMIASLPTGKNSECIMRDIKGHVGTMRVDMSYLPDVISAFDSTPDDGTGRVQSAAKRIITDSSGKVLGIAETEEEAKAILAEAEAEAHEVQITEVPEYAAPPSAPAHSQGPPPQPVSAPHTVPQQSYVPAGVPQAQRQATTYGAPPQSAPPQPAASGAARPPASAAPAPTREEQAYRTTPPLRGENGE